MLRDNPPLRLLIVEDSPDDAELMQLALGRAGLGFVAARVDAQPEFVAQLEAAAPDLILCDFHLPRFSCQGVLEILADRGLAIPVVVVSRHIAAGEEKEVLRLGARACVMKNRLAQLPGIVEGLLKPR